MDTKNTKNIIFKELSYRVQGILFTVQKELGGSYQEKYYQRAVEHYLRLHHIPYRREVQVDIKLGDEKIGHHFLDFLIDDKMILEIKQGRPPLLADVKQVLMYLKSTNKKLAIIAAFHLKKVTIKRVINVRDCS